MSKFKSKSTVLSPREQSVLGLLVEPVEMKEISYRLGISYKTAHSYATSGSQKMGFKTVADAVRAITTKNIVERCAAIAEGAGAYLAAEQMRLVFSTEAPPPVSVIEMPLPACDPEVSVTAVLLAA